MYWKQYSLKGAESAIFKSINEINVKKNHFVMNQDLKSNLNSKIILYLTSLC